MLKHHLLPLLLFLLLLSLAPTLSAQDYTALDIESRAVPFPENEDLSQLAANLTDGLGTEKEKARAIFVWLTHNIRYDVRTAFDEDAETQEVIAKQQPRAVLKRKTAVCEGYANLFCALSEAAGLKAIVVTGLTKNTSGNMPRIGHAWNLVRADSVWGLIDATWGAGDVDDEAARFVPQFYPQYFFASPDMMIENHLPFDPLYQLRVRPISLQEFKLSPEERAAQPVSKPDPHFAHISDSLNALVLLDSATQTLQSIQRTLRYDPTSNRARYLLARHFCNDAVRLYNEYVTEQNNLVSLKARPTKDILLSFNRQIKAADQRAKQSLTEVERITAGDRYRAAAASIKRLAREMQEACTDARKRNDEMLKRM